MNSGVAPAQVNCINTGAGTAITGGNREKAESQACGSCIVGRAGSRVGCSPALQAAQDGYNLRLDSAWIQHVEETLTRPALNGGISTGEKL